MKYFCRCFHSLKLFSGDNLGRGCASDTYNNQYGGFNHIWLNLHNSSDPQSCQYDNKTAIFNCRKSILGKVYVEEIYYCQKTAKTAEIENLADNSVANEKVIHS